VGFACFWTFAFVSVPDVDGNEVFRWFSADKKFTIVGIGSIEKYRRYGISFHHKSGTIDGWSCGYDVAATASNGCLSPGSDGGHCSRQCFIVFRLLRGLNIFEASIATDSFQPAMRMCIAQRFGQKTPTSAWPLLAPSPFSWP